MQALTFWKTVTMDKANFLEALIARLEENGFAYCVIGGQGVNAYVEPLVSLDLDIVIAFEQLERAESVLSEHFRMERFPHSLNLSLPGSELRVQIQTDPRYRDFVGRASQREVLGVRLPVASVEDVLQGKIWAALEPGRRPSKRRKDLLDIERLIEAHPHLSSGVPREILDRLQ